MQLAHGVEKPVDDVLLIEDRKLDREPRQVGEEFLGFGGPVLLVLVIKIDQHITVHAVGGQENQDDEVWDEQGNVEGVGVIQALEGPVEKMLAQVRPNPARGQYKQEYR